MALFALSLVAVLAAGALAFDAGLMLVERRDQQNAADAAALAGAHYLTSRTGGAVAEVAAYAVAAENGFADPDPEVDVLAASPPISGPNRGRNGFIEVQISSTRPSFFAAVLGIFDLQVGARAVAVNSLGTGAGYSILALNPHICEAMKVGGSGAVLAFGDIQVNSDCSKSPHAMSAGGTGTITVTLPGGACDVVGTIDVVNGDQIFCEKHSYPAEVPAIPDPLINLVPCIGVPCFDGDPKAPLDYPDLAPVPRQIPLDGDELKEVPDTCPNSGHSKAATMDEGALCAFGPGYDGTTWRLFPGTYPGGLDFSAGTYLLEPGTYYLAGGLNMNSTGATLISVKEGMLEACTPPDRSSATDDCGVLLYNGSLPIKKGDPGPITLNGGDAGTLLHPTDEKPYNGIVIFQDPGLSEDVTINGGDSDMEVRGTIYVPGGLVTVNGNAGSLVMDQIIADRYKVTGVEGSTITALNDENVSFKVRAAGLIE